MSRTGFLRYEKEGSFPYRVRGLAGLRILGLRGVPRSPRGGLVYRFLYPFVPC